MSGDDTSHRLDAVPYLMAEAPLNRDSLETMPAARLSKEDRGRRSIMKWSEATINGVARTVSRFDADELDRFIGSLGGDAACRLAEAMGRAAGAIAVERAVIAGRVES